MVVLVTGAAQRIGREISLTLAKQGHNIALHFKNSRSCAQQLATEINGLGKGTASIFYADLNDIPSLCKLIEEASSMGTIDHIVNNASGYEHDVLSTVTSDSFDAMMAINLKAPLFLSKAFVQYRSNLLDSPPIGGSLNCEVLSLCPSIINILDQKVASTNADNLSYTIAKHGLHSLTEMLAKGCAPHIRVNAVAPGPVLAHTLQSSSSFRRTQARCPLQGGLSPADVAEAVRYLISARAVTGQTIFVDAGDRLTSKLIDSIE